MNYKEQKKEWAKRRHKIYKEYMKGKKSFNELGREYNLTAQRIKQLVDKEGMAVDN